MNFISVSRLGTRAGSSSPDSMSSSYHGNTSSSLNNDANTLIQMSASLIENVNTERNNIMVQSLDSTTLSSSSSLKMSSDSNSVRSVIPQLNGSYNYYYYLLKCFYELQIIVELILFHLVEIDHQTRQGSPLVAASKMVPVPETLMSPDCPPVNSVQSAIQSNSNPSLANIQRASGTKSIKGSYNAYQFQ